MQTGNSHNWAENQMRDAVVVRRIQWPEGKVAYYDVENDGTPDHLLMWEKLVHAGEAPRELTFIEKEMLLYEGFRQYVRVAVNGSVDANIYITQEDMLANDWVKA